MTSGHQDSTQFNYVLQSSHQSDKPIEDTMHNAFMIYFDEILLARDAIDEETGEPVGPAIDEAVRTLLKDRRITDRRLGAPLVSLDLETVGLPNQELLDGVAHLAFEDTKLGQSRSKPMIVAGSIEQQAAICEVLEAAGVPTKRSDMYVTGPRAVITFVIESPRDLSRIHDAMKALKDADLDTQIALALDSVNYLYDPELMALSTQMHPVDRMLHEIAIHASAHDACEDAPTRLDRIGSLLDEDVRRRERRTGVYRLQDDRLRHVERAAIAAALPETGGFDYRNANQAPRSQRRKRR